jgi:hypothetical protein
MTWTIIATELILAGVILVSAHLITAQLRVIHDLVNSNLTRVTADYEIARSRIETLEEHIASEATAER